MEMNVNKNWTFREFILNLRALRNSYEDFLCSFSCFEQKQKLKFIREFCTQIYDLPYEEWKRDRIWDYLNDDIPFEALISIARK